MNIFKALVMREMLDGKSYYIRTPIILAGLTVAILILSTIFLGTVEIEGMEREKVKNIGEGIAMFQEKKPEELASAVTMFYWGSAILPWIAFPFVIFFSLLGTLYEERRDRSIMFWKSMPVADWQEVLAKLFVPVVIAPLIFMGVTVAAQLVIAIFMALIVLFQGGPALEMLPLGLMFVSWFTLLGHYMISALWTLPLLAWLLLVSSYASRMPFLWAALPPFILIAIEGIFFKTHGIANWILMHLGGWRKAMDDSRFDNIHGPRDVFDVVINGSLGELTSITASSPGMWVGLIIAGGLVYATIEMRKRAI